MSEHANDAVEKISSYAWVMLALVFFSSVAAPLNMAKVPPVLDSLIVELGIDRDTSSWLMSIFAVVGIFIAFPSGFLLRRLGAKNICLLALAIMGAGSILGIYSKNMVILLFSRALEGVGLCLMTVMCPAVISAWFPTHKRGLAMGIWATWVSIGIIIIFIVAPYLQTGFGWQSIWWFGAIYSLFFLALCLVFFRMPAGYTNVKEQDAGLVGELKKMLRNVKDKDPWLVAFSFAAYNTLVLAMTTFIPSFLQHERGFSQNTAALLASTMMVSSMLGLILGGVVVDRVGSFKKTIVFPYIMIAGIMLVCFLPGNFVLLSINVFSLIGGFAVTATFASVPSLAGKPENIGNIMAVLTVGQCLGMFSGPLFFAILLGKFGWVTSGYSFIPLLLLGAAAVWRTRLK